MATMRKLLLFILLCLPLPLLAWNLQGHLLVAQMAYEHLPVATQARADGLADLVFYQLPLADQAFLNRRAKGLSSYARVAALPDTWSDWSVQQLFLRFHALLPAALQPYAQNTTADWHFIDQVYGGAQYCSSALKQQNVVWALPLLQTAFVQAQDPKAQALILILLSHYVADLHQPLHVLSKENRFCSQDGGGNGFCLKNKQGRCVLNLHTFWDSGLGYLKPRCDLARASQDLQQKWPRVDFVQALKITAPLTWAQQEFSYADFIYSTPQNHKPDKAYVHHARELIQKQLVLAGYRLAGMIAADLQKG